MLSKLKIKVGQMVEIFLQDLLDGFAVPKNSIGIQLTVLLSFVASLLQLVPSLWLLLPNDDSLESVLAY
jgi:hypothetical protein